MINKVILVGNVGSDPEVRTLENGVKVARITLATTERMYNRTTQQASEHTEWHSITLWRNLAETADRFIKKGSKLYVEGRIRSRSWTDESGAKRYAFEIQGDDVKMLDRRPEGASSQPAASAVSAQPASTPRTEAQVSTPVMDTPDDLPF
ncbi:MAG: single-stranded DNA-binding protein [Rikenellaceae bacterium]